MNSTRPKARSVVAVFDLDGTITRTDTYVRFLVAFLRLNPRRLARSWWLPWAIALYGVGVRDNTWLKVAFLRTIAGGSSRPEVERVVSSVVADVLEKGLRPEALRAIESHRANGDRLILATASLDIYASRIAEALGFHEAVCTRVRWNTEERLTGHLDGPNCHGEFKKRAVAELLPDRKCVWLVSYSDNETDAPLLHWSDEATVVNPKRRLRNDARESNFRIATW